MAGKNMWHKPYFQPQLNEKAKYCNSKDRYLWESSYNNHLRRLQIIQNRIVYKPTIIKRNYSDLQYRRLNKERSRVLSLRTQINTMPQSSNSNSPAISRATSRPGSCAGSRAGSHADFRTNSRSGSRVQSLVGSRFGSPQSSYKRMRGSAPVSSARMDTIEENRRETVAAMNWRHYSELYPIQNYPVFSRRSTGQSMGRKGLRRTKRQNDLDLDQERELFGYEFAIASHLQQSKHAEGEGPSTRKTEASQEKVTSHKEM